MAHITSASIHCFQCNHDFVLNMFYPDETISCPYCNTKMESSMVEKVTKAWAAVAGVNNKFYRHEIDYEEPRFSLSALDTEVHLPSDD